MRTFFFFLFVGVTQLKAFDAEKEIQGCSKAFFEFKQENFAESIALSCNQNCRLINLLATWKYLLNFKTPNSDIEKNKILTVGLTFLNDAPEFPLRWKIIKRLESLVHQHTSENFKRALLAFNPQPGYDALKFLKSYMPESQVKATVKTIFHETPLNAAKFNSFIESYGHFLDHQDYEIRLYNAFERGDQNSYRLTLKRYPSEIKPLMTYKLKAMSNKTAVPALFKDLPTSDQRSSDGLKILLKSHLANEDAASFLKAVNRFQDVIEKNQKTFQPLIINAARDALIPRDYGLADRLLEKVKNDQSVDYFEARLLRALIKHFFLNQSNEAIQILESGLKGIGLKPLRARYGYWLAEIHASNPEKMQSWLRFAAQYSKSYHGQLALKKLGKPIAIMFQPTKPIQKLPNDHPIRRHLLVTAAHLLEAAKFPEDVSLMVYRLRGRVSEADKKAFYGLLHEKFPGYLMEMSALDHKDTKTRQFYKDLKEFGVKDQSILSDSLFRAIVRKESSFNPYAVSYAGALGLSQMMLDTARKVSGNRDLTKKDLLVNPSFNLEVGHRYLRMLLERFEHDPLTMLAGYNAGPLYPERWIKRYGDPRSGEINPQLWIELIPFKETRWYLQAVLASTEIYRFLGQESPPIDS